MVYILSGCLTGCWDAQVVGESECYGDSRYFRVLHILCSMLNLQLITLAIDEGRRYS